VILCWASNCGVTSTGEGMAVGDAMVITVASIVARDSHSGAVGRVWKAGAVFR
jgi:hypothetical protein